VGKATSLRDRIKSYFRGRLEDRPIATAIEQICDIKILPTETVLEAYILEQSMIKKLQPKYNAMGKDDKSFVYVVLTKEEFPLFMILRKTDLEKMNVIPSLLASHKLRRSGSRNLAVRNRDSSRSLRFIQNDIETSKIYGPYTSRKQIEIVLKLLRRIFPYHSSAQKTEKGCLDFELGRCPGPYAGEISRADYLKNIRGIKMILEGKKKGLVKKMEKEMKDYSKGQEFEKAADARNKLFALKHIRDIALISIENKFEIRNSKLVNLRLEAFDISNISGDYAVGSMVVFSGKEPDKSQYRKFKIKTVKGADDIAMMKEVLIRRFRNDWPKPNLILLDGGVGYLNMGQELLRNLRQDIPIAAVAKGPTRKDSKVESRKSKGDNEAIRNILRDKKLIKSIMDEAHRFAIGYHRKVRSKQFLNK